jgi:hypothetical protein
VTWSGAQESESDLTGLWVYFGTEDRRDRALDVEGVHRVELRAPQPEHVFPVQVVVKPER